MKKSIIANRTMRSLCAIALSLIVTGTSATQIVVNNATEISAASPNPGDTLLMASSGNWTDQSIVIDFVGTAELPIVLLAEGNGQVILTGASKIEISGQHVVVAGLTLQECVPPGGADLVTFKTSSNAAINARLTNCLFKDNNPGDIEIGYKWVSLYGYENRVDHCWFEGKRHRGTTLVVWLYGATKPNFHRIDHNYFTRPVYAAGNNEAETIRIGTSSNSLINSNTIVEYNYFEECDGEIESISNKSGYNVFRYNTFFNNGSILTLRHGHHCTVTGNYFFGNDKSGSGGVRIIGVGHKVVNNYFQDLAGSGNLRAPIVIMGGVDGFDEFDATNRYVAGQDATVAYNTIVNCKQGIYIGSDKASSSETYNPPFDCTIANNIIYNTTDPALEYEYGEISSFTYTTNLYNQTALGKTSSDGFTDIDPELTIGTVLAVGRISSGSPAIGQAVGTFGLSQDIDGDARTGSFDIGCDQYSSNQPTRNPIEKGEVGPCWLTTAGCDSSVATLPDDCHGDAGGTASIDNCGICSGGNTGIAPDGCSECQNVMASSDDGNIPYNTLDNNPATRWSANGDGEYIEYCLDQLINIAQLKIAFYRGDERASYFDVVISQDGIQWDTIISGGESSASTLDFESYDFAGSPAVWKLRIVGRGNSVNTWNSYTMVEWVPDFFTSIASKAANNMTIYPNPVSATIQINGLKSGEFTYQIMDGIGRYYAEKFVCSADPTIDVSQLQPGIYYLQLLSDQEIVIQPFSKR